MTDIIPYSDNYIEACFYAWYKNGRPRLTSANGSHIMKVLPPSPDSRKPTIDTVRTWMTKFGWDMRADALDAELSRKLDMEAIEEKAELYREIASKGKDVMQMGYDYIKENKFDTSASAVRAVFGGAEMVAKFGTAADVLLSVGQMTDKQVEKEILRLLGKNDDENIIDAESEEVLPSFRDSEAEEDDDTKPDDNA